MGNEIPVVGTSPEAQFRFRLTRMAEIAQVAGLVLVGVGWFDILLGWFPFRLGSAEWEFGTVSAMIDAMPLPTVGMVMMLVGAMVAGKQVKGWLAVGSAAVVLLVMLGAGILYATTIPLALGAVTPEFKPQLYRAIAKTSGLLAVYAGFYAWLGYVSFRLLWRPRIKKSADEAQDKRNRK